MACSSLNALIAHAARASSAPGGLDAGVMTIQYATPLIAALLLRLIKLREAHPTLFTFATKDGLANLAAGVVRAGGSLGEARVIMRTFGKCFFIPVGTELDGSGLARGRRGRAGTAAWGTTCELIPLGWMAPLQPALSASVLGVDSRTAYAAAAATPNRRCPASPRSSAFSRTQARADHPQACCRCSTGCSSCTPSPLAR